MKTKRFLLVIVIFFLLFGPLSMVISDVSGATVDHGIYATLLKKYVDQDKVDYHGFKKELESKRDKIKIKYLPYDWSVNGE